MASRARSVADAPDVREWVYRVPRSSRWRLLQWRPRHPHLLDTSASARQSQDPVRHGRERACSRSFKAVSAPRPGATLRSCGPLDCCCRGSVAPVRVPRCPVSPCRVAVARHRAGEHEPRTRHPTADRDGVVRRRKRRLSAAQAALEAADASIADGRNHGICIRWFATTSTDWCEALRNAFRHAHARPVGVEIRYDAQQLRLCVRNDGKGIDHALAAAKDGLGH
jgi:hypothetical protein